MHDSKVTFCGPEFTSGNYVVDEFVSLETGDASSTKAQRTLSSLTCLLKEGKIVKKMNNPIV